MNQRYTKTSSDTMIVRKENGLLEQREIECSDINAQLTLENNLEYINGIIDDLENYIKNGQPFDLDKYLSSLETILFVTLGGTAVGVLYNEGKVLLGGLGVGTACCALTMLWAAIRKATFLQDVKKRKQAYRAVLEKAYIIKKHILNEIERVKSNGSLNDSQIYEPIVISEDISFINSTTMVLNEEYMRNMSSKRLQRKLPLPYKR